VQWIFTDFTYYTYRRASLHPLSANTDMRLDRRSAEKHVAMR